MTLTFDLLTLKVVPESCVIWATSVSILFFLGLSVLDLGPMYATDVRQSDVRQHRRFMPPPIRGGGITSTTDLPARLVSQKTTPLSAAGYDLVKHCPMLIILADILLEDVI